MTITKRLSAIALTLIMLVSLIPMTVFAAGKSGWEEIDGEWYYYQDDQMLKSTWLNYKSKWYYFDQGGMMMADTFFKDIDEKVYVFDKSGAMVSKKGWYMIKMYYGEDTSFNFWFYIQSGGVAAKGWKKISGKWYFFNEYAIMMSGPVYDDGKYYFLNKGGDLTTKTGWVSLKSGSNTYWFYVKKGGICTTGWKKLSGKWYYFGYDGTMYANSSLSIRDSETGEYTTYLFNKKGVCINH